MAKKTFTLAEIASFTQTKLIGKPDYQIQSVATLEQAGPHDASFLANPRYKQAMLKSQAGVIFIDEKTNTIENKNFLIASHPSQAFQQLIDLLHPQRQIPSGFTGTHPTAIIHPTAQIGKNVTIGPYAVIDEHVEIGDYTFVGSHVYVGPQTKIGNNCLIHPNVVIREECTLGNRVIIQPGAIIGSCGFGYITDNKGKHQKLNQVGIVIIEDDVEIGANTTIDRSRFEQTVIGKGSKLDNLVQIGHGVKVGPDNLIVSQTGIAGSTKTGKNVILAGQVAVAGHLELDDGVMIAGKSGVSKSLPTGKYSGIPVLPINEYNRQSVLLRNIENYVDRIKELENEVIELKSKN